MKIDLTFINNHFLLSVLASILFLNVYIIYVIGKLKNETVTHTKKVQHHKKNDQNNKLFAPKKISPKVNDDFAFVKREQLKDEQDSWENKQ